MPRLLCLWAECPGNRWTADWLCPTLVRTVWWGFPRRKLNSDSPLVDGIHCATGWLTQTYLGWIRQGQWNAAGWLAEQGNEHNLNWKPWRTDLVAVAGRGRCLVPVYIESSGTLNGNYCCFPQLPRASAGILRNLGHKCFLQYPFHFIVYQSFLHSTLCNLSYYRPPKSDCEVTDKCCEGNVDIYGRVVLKWRNGVWCGGSVHDFVMAVDEILGCEVWGSHSGVTEDLFLWGVALRGLVDPEADGTTILRSAISYTPKVTAYHLRRPI